MNHTCKFCDGPQNLKIFYPYCCGDCMKAGTNDYAKKEKGSIKPRATDVGVSSKSGD